MEAPFGRLVAGPQELRTRHQPDSQCPLTNTF